MTPLSGCAATASALATPLAPHHRVPTLLTSNGYTLFDALFYWED